MADLSALSDLFSDPYRANELVRNFESIARSVEVIAAKMSSASQEVVSNAEKAEKSIENAKSKAGELADSLNNSADTMGTTALDTMAQIQGASDIMLSTFDRVWEKMKQAVAEWRTGMTIGANLTRALASSPENVLTGVMSALPPHISAVANLFFEQAIRDSAINAKGRRLVTQFLSTEGLGADFAQTRAFATRGEDMLKDARSSLRNLGLDETAIEAQVKAVRDTGGKFADAIKEGFDTKTEELRPFGAVGFASELDLAFNQVQGTAMRIAGELARVTNVPRDEALKSIRIVGGAAREMGEDFNTVVTNVRSLTQAFRMQGSDASELSAIYARMGEAVKTLSGGRLTEDRQREVTGAAFGGLSSLANLPKYLYGPLYRDITKYMGIDSTNMSSTDILMHMATGMKFAGGTESGLDFTSASLLSLGKLFNRPGMSQTTLAALLSHHGGIPNPDSAMALAEIIQSKGGLEGALNKDAIAKLEKIGEEQAKAVKDMAPLNNDTFKTMMDQIKQVVQDFTTAILQSLLLLVKMVQLAVIWLFTDQKTADVKAVLRNELDRVGKTWGRVASSAGQLAGGIGNPLDLGFEVPVEHGARFNLQRVKAKEALSALHGGATGGFSQEEAERFAGLLVSSGLAGEDADEETIAKGLAGATEIQAQALVQAYDAGLRNGIMALEKAFNEKSETNQIVVSFRDKSTNVVVPGTTFVPTHTSLLAGRRGY